METLTQSQLTEQALQIMDDDKRISKAQANDFLESARAVLEESIAEGNKVSVWGIVTLTPVFKLAKPRRKGVDPRTGEEQMLKAKPAEMAFRKPSVGKRFKDSLPSPKSKAAEPWMKQAEKAAKQAAKRAREAAKAEKVAA
jgi:nucleoid DNA-binding protein